MPKPDRNRGDDCCAATVAQLHAIAEQLYWRNNFELWKANGVLSALDDATGPPPPPPPPPQPPEIGGD